MKESMQKASEALRDAFAVPLAVLTGGISSYAQAKEQAERLLRRSR